MNYQKQNFISNIYFSLILFIGFSYVALLSFSFVKIFPGFAMQIIFLLDSVKFNNSIILLITSQMFLLNVVPGLLLTGLIIRFFQSLVNLAKNIQQTFHLIKELNIIKSTDIYTKFKSKQNSIFTLGFFKPQIYISSSIFKSHSVLEIQAMIQHEINHQNNLHALKIFISNFIKSATPNIPSKDLLFDGYLTTTEVSSDIFSENQTNTKRPLVSALLKFQDQNFEALPTSISYFNSQSERIKILVGQKKQFLRIPMAYYSLVLVVILSGTIFVKNTNIFYDCQHLLKCVELLITPNSQPLITPFSVSDHCQ